MLCDQLAENIAVCFVITGCSAVETYEYWLASSLYKRLTLSTSLKIKAQTNSYDCGHNNIANVKMLKGYRDCLVHGKNHMCRTTVSFSNARKKLAELFECGHQSQFHRCGTGAVNTDQTRREMLPGLREKRLLQLPMTPS